MATVVSATDPSLQEVLRVDADGNLLVVVKGGGGGGSTDISHLDTKAELEQAVTAAQTARDALRTRTEEVHDKAQKAEDAGTAAANRSTEAYKLASEAVTREQLDAATSGVPRTVAIIKYTNVRCGGQAPKEWLPPLGTLDTTDPMVGSGAWPAIRATNNLVMYMPEAGMYSCQVIVSSPSTQVVYLKDGQGTMAGLEGPKDPDKPVTLGTGMTFVFSTDIPNRLIRLPLAAPGSNRPAVGDCTFLITKLK